MWLKSANSRLILTSNISINRGNTMYTEINQSSFIDAFRSCGRAEQFTYDGLVSLYDYLEEYEDSTGEKVELDVIALCCDFTEYADLSAFQSEYNEGYESIEDIENATTVIRIDDESFIILCF